MKDLQVIRQEEGKTKLMDDSESIHVDKHEIIALSMIIFRLNCSSKVRNMLLKPFQNNTSDLYCKRSPRLVYGVWKRLFS